MSRSCGYISVVRERSKSEVKMLAESVAHSVTGTVISATETVPEKKTRSRVTEEPPYKVILHNDDFTPMEHVVATLRKVIPRMSTQRAVSIMIEAHTKGKAVATKCHKELAEMYEESLRSEGLVATIEPD